MESNCVDYSPEPGPAPNLSNVRQELNATNSSTYSTPVLIPRSPHMTCAKINDRLSLLIKVSLASTNDPDYDPIEDSQTELDSHANMPVVGRHVEIISDTGRVAEVNPFTPDYQSMSVRIVDAAVRYQCPFSGTTHILIVRNALSVPSMQHNLLPPFILREAGVEVNETPKIQVDDPNEEHHSIFFPQTGLRIPLSLWGIFLYFPTSKPTVEEMQSSENIYLLTPSVWNPHNDSYADNEENMLDWEGNIKQKQDQPKILLREINNDPVVSSCHKLSPKEDQVIDATISSASLGHSLQTPCSQPGPCSEIHEYQVLPSISSIFTDVSLYEALYK